MKTLITRLAAIALLTASGLAIAQEDDAYEGDAKDAWLTGKVETVFLLNEHLSNFDIDTDVTNGTVRLTGAVESEVDRELAGELAEGVEGVDAVENELTVEGERAAASTDDADTAGDNGRDGRPFGAWVDDATTTAAVKTRLVRNRETQGLEIDVDTHEDVVTLSGRVRSEQEKELAQQIAMNTNDVRDVRNNLVVDPE